MPTTRTVTARLSFRKGSTADWSANDPILQDSEPAWDSTLKALKIGDGVRGWSEMDYIAKGSPNPNITIEDDPGAVNFSNYAQKGNMMYELSAGALYIATVSATLANIAPRSNFISSDIGKVVGLRTEFNASDIGREIIGIGGGVARGLVDGDTFEIASVQGNPRFANFTLVGGAPVVGSGIIDMTHLGAQWQFK